MELIFQVLVIYTIVQRILELRVSRGNEKEILALGGRIIPEKNYIFMIALHGTWLIYLLYASFFCQLSFSPPMVVFFTAVFFLGQFFRLKAITTLGNRWSTRIMVLPGAPVIQAGIFRYFRHPNYLGVALEIAALPLIAGMVRAAIVFTLINAIILIFRIRLEERCLCEHNDYREKFARQARR